MVSKGTTVRAFRESVSDWNFEEWIIWPPDVFALTSLLLGSTGAYRYAVCPPEVWPADPDWEESVRTSAEDWRMWLTGNRTDPPKLLRKNIQAIESNEDSVSIDDLRSISAVGPEAPWIICRAFLELHALSDQACRGFGLPSARIEKLKRPTELDTEDEIRSIISGIIYQANMLLATRGSLSRLPKHKVLVLPKMRTPSVGLTLRSLSHHVTMHVSEVDVVWRSIPWINRDEDTLNIMVYPWPREMKETWFWPEDQSLKRRSGEPARFFTYRPPDDLPLDEIMGLLEQAEGKVTRIHAIVFPELALTQEELRELQLALASKQRRDRMPMIVAGIRDSRREGNQYDGRPGANRIVLSSFFADTWYDLFQDKHHRWKLDRNQIEQYRLSGVLAADRDWWEAIEVRERRITFLAPNGWFILCPLICEDLARLEPVSEVIRGVGPTLLIAILLDGPQIRQRWSSRYASVLADDPGTSVLTVSSLGMAKHSRPPAGAKQIGTIALWKDQVSGWEEVTLKGKEAAVVLTISASRHKEYAADGRSDSGTAAVFSLRGSHKLSVEGASAGSQKRVEFIRLGRDIDFKELTIFSYLVDALMDASRDLIGDIMHWALGESSCRSRWCSKSRIQERLMAEIKKEIDANYSALGDSEPMARREFKKFVKIVSRVVMRARLRALKSLPEDEVEKHDHLFAEWAQLVAEAKGILLLLSKKERAHEWAVVALSILWGVHKRLANHRRAIGLTMESVELLREVESLLPGRWFEVSKKNTHSSLLWPKVDPEH